MSGQQAPRVLLVDDDLEFRRLIEHLLKKFGIQVFTTGSPEEFLKRLGREPFDLALVDLNMGREEMGNLVIQAVRKVLGPDVPLYIVSGSHGIQHYRAALAAGANDFILKPLDRKLLAAKLSQHFVTQEMTEWLDSRTELPEGQERALLRLPMKILEVSETGFKVRSPHLLLRGTRFVAQGEDLKEVFLGYGGKIELVVREVWREPAPEDGATGYVHLMDLDNVRPDAYRLLRVWLMRRRIEVGS